MNAYRPPLPVLRLPRSSGTTNLFHAFYTPLFAPWRRDRENLNPGNILYHKLLDNYQVAPKDILRWQVVANTAVKEVPKAVMRERLRRRVREAFREALKQEGYDSKGKVLRSETTTGKPFRDLKGTLEIHCRTRAGLDCEFVEMTKYAKSAVSAVVQSFNYGTQKRGFDGTEWWKPDVRSYGTTERMWQGNKV